MLNKLLGNVILIAFLSTSNAGQYSIEVLPKRFGNETLTYYSINDHGTVLAESRFGPFRTGGKRILTYEPSGGLSVVLDNLRQDSWAYGPHINNAGQILYTNTQSFTRNYLYTPNFGSVMLPGPINRHHTPFNLNNRGEVTGQIIESSGSTWATWSVAGQIELFPQVRAIFTTADNGTLLGQIGSNGFVRRPGQEIEIVPFSGGSGAVFSMNSAGQVIGGYTAYEAQGQVVWIFSPDLQSHVEIPMTFGRLLDDGTVIGAASGLAHNLAISKWSAAGGVENITQMLDAQSLALGFNRWTTRDVNQRGEILATAFTELPDGSVSNSQSIIIRPVPEPGTMLALGAGLAALLRRRRTR